MRAVVRFAAAAAAILLAAGAAAQQPVEPIRASKIILVGDSTTAVIGGWGPSFCANHVTSAAACVNLGRGGRSSGSYRAEGSWEIALAEMKTPGYSDIWVVIQFGHNDQPGKPGRSTDLETEFPANLRRFVAEARAAGAKPVLLTPLTRRIFVAGTLTNDLEPWAEAVRRVAAETGAPLVDLNALSTKAVQAMGPTLAARFAGAALAGGRRRGSDRNHHRRVDGRRSNRPGSARAAGPGQCRRRAARPGAPRLRLHPSRPRRRRFLRRHGGPGTGAAGSGDAPAAGNMSL